MDYRIDGYGVRREAKMAWPLYLVTLNLKGLTSTISQLLHITMTDEYRSDPNKVRAIPLRSISLYSSGDQLLLKAGELREKGDAAMRKKCEAESIAFIDRAGPNFPPNFVLVIDTHSDGFSGRLITNKHSGSQSLDKLLEAYFGGAFLDNMALASSKARSSKQTPVVLSDAVDVNSKPTWTPYSQDFRGGWRVAILVTCGPTAKNEGHWERISDALRA
jgi:hypothetical protein